MEGEGGRWRWKGRVGEIGGRSEFDRAGKARYMVITVARMCGLGENANRAWVGTG